MRRRLKHARTIAKHDGRRIIQTEATGARGCWVVTDGRAGVEAQALGLAEAIAERTPLAISVKRIRLAPPWRYLPPPFLGDAFSRLEASGDALAPPYPDLWIGCGRASAPLGVAVKKKRPDIFVVQLQDPRIDPSRFDLVIPPAHDGLAGENVFSIVGSPNRIQRLKAMRQIARSDGADRRDILAVLIGGPNKAFRFSDVEARDIAAQLKSLARGGAILRVTTSRRTPLIAADILQTALADDAEIFWRADKTDNDANPYPSMLAGVRAILVTEDSVNMAAEAASTGAPIYILALGAKRVGASKKFDAFHQSLQDRGASRRFRGALEDWTYEPLDETARAAAEVIRRWR